MISYQSGVMSDQLAPQALPLVQATWPEVDLLNWLSFVRFFNGETTGPESCILVMSDPSGHLCGILAYRLDHNLRDGLMLSIPLFTAVDVANSLQTVRALLDIAKARASELGCAGVQIRMDKEQSKLAARLRSLGLSSEAGLLCTHLRPRAGLREAH
jgi:hypothetical protein